MATPTTQATSGGSRTHQTTSFTLSSSAFADGTAIPAKYAREGPSPPLSWTAIPGVKAWALIVEDPDAPAGTWTHWTAWNLPGALTSLPEGASISQLGGVEGTTSDKRTGYSGPAPPSGTHRYQFRLYALSSTIPLAAGDSVQQLKSALQGKTLAEAQLMGTYTK
jgi:Raf kinase inhibitor-like YbhB/YbcL family protein